MARLIPSMPTKRQIAIYEMPKKASETIQRNFGASLDSDEVRIENGRQAHLAGLNDTETGRSDQGRAPLNRANHPPGGAGWECRPAPSRLDSHRLFLCASDHTSP